MAETEIGLDDMMPALAMKRQHPKASMLVHALALNSRDDAWASAPALMAKALGPARAVAAQGFTSWSVPSSVLHTPLPPNIPRHENDVLAQGEEPRRRGVLEPLHAPQLHASLPATAALLR
jgi:hypothetical protein